jgi:hypothetical protein
LNKELAGLESKKEYTTYVRPKIKKDSLIEAPVITPDESSVVIELDGGGVVTPDNLLIYLIPYTKKVKKYMVYEASCSLGLSENRVAQYYNGVYFFNAVDNGKYLIKICTPYGNYKRITKESEKQTIKMKIAPPLQ